MAEDNDEGVVEIEAINFDERYVVLADGTQLPIVQYLDDEGDDSDEPCPGGFILAGSTEFGYVEFELYAIEEVAYH